MTLRRRTDRQDGDQNRGDAEPPEADRVLPLVRYFDSEKGNDERSSPPELAQVGQHVASVLAAAEAAAAELRKEAEDEARQIRQAAEQAAGELRERAKVDSDAGRNEARRQVALAEQEAHATRADADSYAETRRREADAEAMRVVRDAEARASRLADEAADRHRVLLADISASENRMRHLATSLREVADRLEGVAGAGAGGGDRDDRDESAALDRRLGRRAAEAARMEPVQ
jgi:hypothetical protein